MPFPAALLGPSLAAMVTAQAPTDGCPGIFVYFNSGSARLETSALHTLEAGLQWMRPMVEAGAWLNLDGNSDDLGSSEFNLALSRRRADAVRDYYLHRGVPQASLRVVAHGDNRPLAEPRPGLLPEQWRRENRNVQIWPEMPKAVFDRFYPPGAAIC